MLGAGEERGAPDPLPAGEARQVQPRRAEAAALVEPPGPLVAGQDAQDQVIDPERGELALDRVHERAADALPAASLDHPERFELADPRPRLPGPGIQVSWTAVTWASA
jgi:hypothetical protein